jgi:glutamate N-acetyltransferase / amino-acid N-acetyltransferase
VDTDTSTSDTAAVLASGAAGRVDPGQLEAALLEVCTELVRTIASDGEGASTLIEVRAPAPVTTRRPSSSGRPWSTRRW